MDTLSAARWQMTVSLAFHMIFAAIGIGLPLLMVLVERAYLKTGDEAYLKLAKKWAKATGLLFVVGAISGTALSFELGLLWPRYMEITGAVVGHVFALEGFAFFIEAIFIGLYLYGWDRMSARQHWWCGVVIALSGALSGVLILGVNSWMQLPVGFVLDGDGRVIVTDPIAIFKRYGWFAMGLHSTLSCYIAVSFAVAGIYACGWLRGRRDTYHAGAIRIAMAVGAVTAIVQPISGDLLAKFVFDTQPAKFAAMEGQFAIQPRAPLRIGGIPNLEKRRTEYAIEIPGGLSFLAAHDFDAIVPGLNAIPRENWPNVHITHIAFQIMVAVGMAMVALSIGFWIAWWKRGRAALDIRWLMRALVVASSFGYIGLEAGWIVTEVGRQPWVINGILRTSDAVTTADGVVEIFYLFTLLYLILGITVIVLLRTLREPARHVQELTAVA